MRKCIELEGNTDGARQAPTLVQARKGEEQRLNSGGGRLFEG